MELRVATLCDFAQVRENLLHVSSAGITRVWRQRFPARLDVMLGLLFELEPEEAREPYEVRIYLDDADGGRLAEHGGWFQIEGVVGQDPGEALSIPYVADIRDVKLPRTGRYQVSVEADDTVAARLAFRADILKIVGGPAPQ